jgi:hypothetical protein
MLILHRGGYSCTTPAGVTETRSSSCACSPGDVRPASPSAATVDEVTTQWVAPGTASPTSN